MARENQKLSSILQSLKSSSKVSPTCNKITPILKHLMDNADAKNIGKCDRQCCHNKVLYSPPDQCWFYDMILYIEICLRHCHHYKQFKP